MAVEREDDLGLSLSLSFPESSSRSLQLNLMPSSSSRPPPPTVPSSSTSPALSSFGPLALQKSLWHDPFASSSDRNSGVARSFLRGIDVNRMPATVDCEDDAGVSSPNSTISTVSGKRCERDPMGDELHDTERACSRGASDEEDGDASRKKLRLSKDQSAILEESFKEHNTLNPKQKLALAKRLNLRARQVEVWFQNRRARTKLKQTEVDCEFLRRCCENLTDENRRLQKEVQELRALKLSPQFYMQMTPPTTLTMCPSCERVAVPPSSAQAQQQQQQQHKHPSQAQNRPVQMNPWAASAANPAPAPHRPFDAFHLRS